MVELPCKHYNHGANNMISERSEMGKQNGVVIPRGKWLDVLFCFLKEVVLKSFLQYLWV